MKHKYTYIITNYLQTRKIMKCRKKNLTFWLREAQSKKKPKFNLIDYKNCQIIKI